MVREVKINSGIIGGYEKELIEKILPHLSGQFKQRKEFWEYYFNPVNVELDLEDIDNLSKEFKIELDWDSLVIFI